MSRVTASSDIGDLTLRRLEPADTAALLALSDAAGWNQVAADWRLMLTLGEGIGFWHGDRPVASALILPYDAGFAWLSMVLVAESWRRRGLASRLTQECMARARARGLSLRLVATEAGRAVYRRFGFADQYTFTRYLIDAPPAAGAPGLETRLARPKDLASAVDCDARAFGARRADVLGDFLGRRATKAWLVPPDGASDGIAIMRDGRRASHLGPLIANDTESAMALVKTCLGTLNGPAIIDAVNDREEFLGQLTDIGFAARRRFTRMNLDEPPLNAQSSYYAVAGPEYG